ncbi:MAG: hypothetical protein ACI3ZN_09120 [Candidatus Cryptobacteroides sp.]
MDFIDILIALLFVIVPFAGKVIEKRLKKSSDSTKKIDSETWKENLREIIKEMREDKEEVEQEDAAGEDVVLVGDGSVAEDIAEEAPVRTAPALKPVAMPVEVRGAEESRKNDKNRIDPKKLVIYSEIMTPKFRD